MIDDEPIRAVSKEVRALDVVRGRGLDAYVVGEWYLPRRRARRQVRDETRVDDVLAVFVRRVMPDDVGRHARNRGRCWRYASPTASEIETIHAVTSSSSAASAARSPSPFGSQSA